MIYCGVSIPNHGLEWLGEECAFYSHEIGCEVVTLEPGFGDMQMATRLIVIQRRQHGERILNQCNQGKEKEERGAERREKWR